MVVEYTFILLINLHTHEIQTKKYFTYFKAAEAKDWNKHFEPNVNYNMHMIIASNKLIYLPSAGCRLPTVCKQQLEAEQPPHQTLSFPWSKRVGEHGVMVLDKYVDILCKSSAGFELIEKFCMGCAQPRE